MWDAASSQELLTLRGHADSIQSVAWSPDGRRLATGSDDRTAKMWDAASGQELTTLPGHQGGVSGIAFSPDGKRLATSSYDCTAKVWDAASGRELLRLPSSSDLPHQCPESSIVLRSPDLPHYHVDVVLSVAFSPDGKRLATTSRDNTAKLWDAITGKELLTLRGHEGNVRHVAFSRDGDRLATAGGDQTARIWDVTSGQLLLTLRGGHRDSIYSVAFSPDGKRLATASADGTVQIYALYLRELLDLAHRRIALAPPALTSDECKRYFQTSKCPPLP